MSGSGVFWATIVGFLAGVFVRSFLPLGWAAVSFCAAVSVAFFALGRLDAQRRSAFVFAALALFSLGGGIARMRAAAVTGDRALNTRIGKSVALEGMVVGEPDARETSTIIIVAARSLKSGASSTPVSARVLAILPAHALVRYGDLVGLSGTLELPQAFDTGLGRQFNYPQYLAAQGVWYTISFARIDTHGNAGNPVIATVYGIEEAFVAGIRAVLPEPEAGLASGITVGDKRSIGPDLATVFQRDSLLHMIVLSGYNITVVLNFFAWLLQRAPRIAQFGGSVGIVVFFMLMTGGTGSAMRAGIMALVAVLARATHRVYLGERALAVSAFLMVLWDPFTLAFDPSFQLSALATFGLILFAPLFSRWYARVPERFGAREILASTSATQLMVLPLLLYQSGTLSLVSLPANLLALFPVPFAMLFSFVAALGGMAFGTYAAALALPAYLLLRYIIAVASALASLPFAVVNVPAFNAWWMAAGYVALALLWVNTRPFVAKVPESKARP